MSVNRVLDLEVWQDGGNYGTTLPLVLGNDPSGVVVQVGPEVEGLKVDNRVTVFRGIRCLACPPCFNGPNERCHNPKMLGVQIWGGYAE